jgi:predicted outer membrane repeat protein
MNIKVNSIQALVDAIIQANQEPTSPHTIHLSGKHSAYVLVEPKSELFGKNGLPIIQSNLTIEGNGITISRAPAAPKFRLMIVSAKLGKRHARLTLNNLNFQDGNSWTMGGGAILNDAPMTLNNCQFHGNTGSLGGAIYNGDGMHLDVKSCTFSENTALDEGGAIYSSGAASLNMRDCHFSGNEVSFLESGDIQIHNGGRIQIENTHTSRGIAVNRHLLDAQQIAQLKTGKLALDQFIYPARVSQQPLTEWEIRDREAVARGRKTKSADLPEGIYGTEDE